MSSAIRIFFQERKWASIMKVFLKSLLMLTSSLKISRQADIRNQMGKKRRKVCTDCGY